MDYLCIFLRRQIYNLYIFYYNLTTFYLIKFKTSIGLKLDIYCPEKRNSNDKFQYYFILYTRHIGIYEYECMVICQCLPQISINGSHY
jgi:hypothetical protein